MFSSLLCSFGGGRLLRTVGSHHEVALRSAGNKLERYKGTGDLYTQVPSTLMVCVRKINE